MPTRISPQNIVIPHSSSTVSVSLIKAFERFVGPGKIFYAPAPGVAGAAERFGGHGLTFLVEHPASGRKVLFDSGMRKDVENLAPAIVGAFKDPITGKIDAIVHKEVAEQLQDNGVDPASIEAVIWSHSHFDHINLLGFPATTIIVAGAGTQEHYRPAYPLNPNSFNLESDFEGHEFKEIQFDGTIIGTQRSYDYFGDGSFYLVEAPGHCVGNLFGLARVASDPSSFVLLGGDTAHHPALVRPSPFSPLPEDKVVSLPAGLRSAAQFDASFLRVPATGVAIHHDRDAAEATTHTIQAFDARADVWLVLFHDESILLSHEGKAVGEGIPLLPATINDWRSKGYKERTFWAFLEAGNPANQWESLMV